MQNKSLSKWFLAAAGGAQEERQQVERQFMEALVAGLEDIAGPQLAEQILQMLLML